MKLKYEKNWSDSSREDSDLKTNPVMRFLKHQEYYKFNIGDIVLKQTKWSSNRDWETCNTAIGAPKKFMYVFENELGIGYIKQLKVDGSGFTSGLQCTANFDPDTTRLVLDPDFVDHMLVGEEDFQYNKEYINKKNFRQEAIANNRKLLVSTQSHRKRIIWFHGLKVGDHFWFGDTFDELVKHSYEVMEVKDLPIEACPSHVKDNIGGQIDLMPHYRVITARRSECTGNDHQLTQDCFAWKKVTSTKPYPLKDELCGHQK